MSQEFDPPVATQQAGPAAAPPSGATRLVTWHDDLVVWVDQLGWLRTVNDWLTAALVPFRERHQDNLALELMHGGRWVGHPLHPALSDLPVGLWTAATVLDVTDRSPAPGPGLDAAGMLSAAGIVASCATALTGLTDWTVSDEQDRRVGLFHGLLNTAALGLQSVSLGARVTGHRGTARALGAASLTVTAAAAYLGGHLVFTKGVMVNRVGWAVGPRRWARALSGGRPARRLAGRRRGRGPADLALPPRRQPLRHRQHLQPRGRPAQPRHRRGPDGDLPAARVPLRPRGRLRPPRPGSPAATRAAYPDPQRLDRGARQPAGTTAARNRKDIAMAFVIVANLDDLEVGDTMLVDELREPICLIRLDDDDVRAIHNTCTHQQQPLHEGSLQEDDTLVCAAHASRYNLTTGEAVGVFACGPIPVYACKIEDDAILVDLDQQLNDAPIPRPPAPGSLGSR